MFSNSIPSEHRLHDALLESSSFFHLVRWGAKHREKGTWLLGTMHSLHRNFVNKMYTSMLAWAFIGMHSNFLRIRHIYYHQNKIVIWQINLSISYWIAIHDVTNLDLKNLELGGTRLPLYLLCITIYANIFAEKIFYNYAARYLFRE